MKAKNLKVKLFKEDKLMCVPNINATISLFSNVKNIDNQGELEFCKPFDIIMSRTINDGIRCIGGFYIVIDMTLLSTNNEERIKDNVVATKGKLNVLLRLTKTDRDLNRILHLDLDEFTIDAGTEIIHENACIPYINYKKIKKIDANAIQLSPQAQGSNYVLKILVQRPCDSDWQLQTLFNLKIE